MSSRRNNLTQARLRELLEYDPLTGVFRWRANWGLVKAGAIAGHIERGPYRCIGIDDEIYRAHRLAWLYVHRRWPTNHMDHINGDGLDNRIANLREATLGENGQNVRKAFAHNKRTGLLGVKWDGKLKNAPWRARIQLNKRRFDLGAFATPEEAHAAYIEAKRRLHPFGML